MRDRLDEIGADVRIAVLDACESGAFTRANRAYEGVDTLLARERGEEGQLFHETEAVRVPDKYVERTAGHAPYIKYGGEHEHAAGPVVVCAVRATERVLFRLPVTPAPQGVVAQGSWWP